MTDEKEQKEIVLGNTQLLSIFFLVVAMMGVAFTIGYMIGRNTAGVSAAAAGPATGPTASTPSAPATDNSSPASGVSKADDNQAPAATQSGGTQPAKPYESEATPRPVPAEASPAESQAAPASPPPANTRASQGTTGTGSYLQAAAVKREDADHLVIVLRKRGFPALLGESPKEGLFRVLVGPYKDMASLADAKQKLRAAGFEPVVAK
jgi:cell division septation protein DedD